MESSERMHEAGSVAEILERAEVLRAASELSAELQRLAAARRGTLTYHDSAAAQWSIRGYDFVFFDDALNIRHAVLDPAVLGIPGTLHEREAMERALVEQGYTVDDTEQFRAALHRVLAK